MLLKSCKFKGVRKSMENKQCSLYENTCVDKCTEATRVYEENATNEAKWSHYEIWTKKSYLLFSLPQHKGP